MGQDTAEFTLDVLERKSQRVRVPISNVVIAGWTGRDPVAVEHHIAELAALGVKRPSSVPMFYPVASAPVAIPSRPSERNPAVKSNLCCSTTSRSCG
jgi:hypothetical protein